MSAAGSSHEICVPNSAPNMRVMPVGPHMPVWPPPPPTLPVSLPVSRPKPLYPKTSSSTLLCCEPPMYGRDDAGHNSTMAIHQPAATSMATHARVSCQTRFHHDTGAAIRYTSPKAGSTSSAWSILARKPKPIMENANTSHPVLPRSSARIIA